MIIHLSIQDVGPTRAATKPIVDDPSTIRHDPQPSLRWGTE